MDHSARARALAQLAFATTFDASPPTASAYTKGPIGVYESNDLPATKLFFLFFANRDRDIEADR